MDATNPLNSKVLIPWWPPISGQHLILAKTLVCSIDNQISLPKIQIYDDIKKPKTNGPSDFWVEFTS